VHDVINVSGHRLGKMEAGSAMLEEFGSVARLQAKG